jgi:hypothetical protein
MKNRPRSLACVCKTGLTAEPWPQRPCSICDGYGSLSMRALSRLLGEQRSTLILLDKLRCKPPTAERILGKLAALEKKKPPAPLLANADRP